MTNAALYGTKRDYGRDSSALACRAAVPEAASQGLSLRRVQKPGGSEGSGVHQYGQPPAAWLSCGLSNPPNP